MFIALALGAGCTAVNAPAATETQGTEAVVALAGWYRQDPRSAIFQPCGSATALRTDDPALRQRARDFDLQDDLPVYVRLRGIRSGTAFDVTRIEQFGSPTPIRDCPMSGTTIQH